MLTRWLCGLVLCVAHCLALGQNVLPVPPLTGHVIDSTDTLGVAQRQALEEKLTNFEANTGAQVVVLMIPSTLPEDIFSYSNRVAGTWKIGRKDVGDGLLLVVAKNDRKLRIEVARTLEGAIPDLVAKQILDEFITPRFKEGDFAGGIDDGVERVMGLIKGEALPAPTRHPPNGHVDKGARDGFQWRDLMVISFLGVMVLGVVAPKLFGNKVGALFSGGVVGAMVWSITASVVLTALAALGALFFVLVSGTGRSGRGGSGWGGGGSSGGSWGSGSNGGGFSSGGGGSFGGGGASGGW